MISIQIQVLPNQLDDAVQIHQIACSTAKVSIQKFPYIRILRKSLDARKKVIKYNLLVELSEKPINNNVKRFTPKTLGNKQVIIIGAGPCGLFAALQAIELGIKPIIFERGQDVRSRRRDLALLNKEGIVNVESNYCFGEGGAGTYSDGKLYTRSKKRGEVAKVLNWLVDFGASSDILIDSHPHIGTNKLPQIITNIREKIIECGGEVHFNSKLTDITIANRCVKSITINNEFEIDVNHLILATGHSARDIFYLLHHKKVKILAKGIAIGVRIEHDQSLINLIQYHGKNELDLPPASYSLVTQVNGRGVYSFCMCPGGIIAPCATEKNEVVTNGWSPSKRNNPFANSGIVVSIQPSDINPNQTSDPFICLDFQKKIEFDCWESTQNSQRVPAQRLLDFIEGKRSSDLPKSSYKPGITSVDLNQILPNLITENLKIAFLSFGKKMKGFLTNDAILHAPESRTSSPISIPRNKSTYEHLEISGLFPCGEGAGYAGGIVSAAIDGMNCIIAIANQ